MFTKQACNWVIITPYPAAAVAVFFQGACIATKQEMVIIQPACALVQCDNMQQGFSVYVSTLTLTIIAIDRYVVIVYPFRARMQV